MAITDVLNLTPEVVAEQNPELHEMRKIAFGENYLQDIAQGTGTAQYYTGWGNVPDVGWTVPEAETPVVQEPVVQDPTTMIPQTGGGGEGITGASVVQPTIQDPTTMIPQLGSTTMDQAGAVAAMTPNQAYSIPGEMPKTPAEGMVWGPQEYFQPEDTTPNALEQDIAQVAKDTTQAEFDALAPEIGYGVGEVDPKLAEAAGIVDYSDPNIDAMYTDDRIVSEEKALDPFAYTDRIMDSKLMEIQQQNYQNPSFWDTVKSTYSTDGISGVAANFGQSVADAFSGLAEQGINVGKMAGSAIMNAIAPGLGFVVQALPQESLANKTSRSIVDELKGQKDKPWSKFSIQSGNLNQDPFGRNPVSFSGNYEQTLTDDVLGINQTGFQTAEMREAKKAFAEAYFNDKAKKAGGVEDPATGDVWGPGEVVTDPDEVTTLEDLQAEERKEGLEKLGETYTDIMQTRDPGKDEGVDTVDTTDDFDGWDDTGYGYTEPTGELTGAFDIGKAVEKAQDQGRGGVPEGSTAQPGRTGHPSGGDAPGGGGCVVATHAVKSGAFTPETKREAVRWCVKNLHRTWWGEAIRRGYRYYGQKAIEEGKVKNHYKEFKDYVAFGTGRKRTLKTGWTFVYRTVQFFLKGLVL